MVEAGPGACANDRRSCRKKPLRRKLTATPEMIARRVEALKKIRTLNPYREIADPVEWQREFREDCQRPGRD